jgi:hypothetical protein
MRAPQSRAVLLTAGASLIMASCGGGDSASGKSAVLTPHLDFIRIMSLTDQPVNLRAACLWQRA